MLSGILARALELNPSSPEAYNGLGFVYDMRGEYEDAFRCINKALELRPSFPEAIYLKGYVYLDMKQYDEAYRSISKALEMKPNFPKAHNAMGNYWDELMEYDKAIKATTKLLIWIQILQPHITISVTFTIKQGIRSGYSAAKEGL
jgi:Flp pilus assembly protein TadD, contains TPR repeats